MKDERIKELIEKMKIEQEKYGFPTKPKNRKNRDKNKK